MQRRGRLEKRQNRTTDEKIRAYLDNFTQEQVFRTATKSHEDRLKALMPTEKREKCEYTITETTNQISAKKVARTSGNKRRNINEGVKDKESAKTNKYGCAMAKVQNLVLRTVRTSKESIGNAPRNDNEAYCLMHHQSSISRNVEGQQ